MSDSHAPRVSYRVVLGNAEFRWLWIAQFQSTMGDQIGRVALAVLVFSRTGSPASTALTYGLTLLPAVISGPLLSGLADLLPRRRVLIGCDLARVVLIGLMAVRGIPLLVVGALLVVATMLEAPFSAAANSLVPSLFEGDAYDVASGLRSTANQTAQLVGFAVGGVLVAAVHAPAALLIDAATFLLSAVLVGVGLHFRPAATETVHHSQIRATLQQSREGLRLAFGRAPLRHLMLAVWLAGVLTVAEGLAVPYVAQVHGPRGSVGFLMAALPLGYIVGTALFIRLVPLPRRSAVSGLLVALCGAPIAVMLAVPPIGVAIALWAASGVCTAYLIYAMPTFVRLTPDATRGSTVGVAGAGLLGVQGLAIWGFGAVGEVTGTAQAIGWAGVFSVLVGVGLAVTWRRSILTKSAALARG